MLLRGPGLRDAAAARPLPIDVGNAGTLIRLLPGWLAGQSGGGQWTLDGDESIRRRPMGRIVEPLRQMGAQIEARDGAYAPLHIGGTDLDGIDYELPMASAQVKSCVLLAGILADGRTGGDRAGAEPRPHRAAAPARPASTSAARARASASAATTSSSSRPSTSPATRRRRRSSPPPPCSFPARGSSIEDMAANWTRVGFFRILERMGGIVVGPLETPSPELTPDEPVCELDVSHGPLTGTVVEPDEVPLAIDELPLVALLGCFAEGETVVRGAQELRLKESDRIATVVDGLRGLGADIEATEDGFVVRGSGGLRGGVLEAHGDHRLAMLGAVAGLASREGVRSRGWRRRR